MKSIILTCLFLFTVPIFGQNIKQSKTLSKTNEIKKLLVGDYKYSEGCCHCSFQLTFKMENNTLLFHLKTNKRNIKGNAKIQFEKQYAYVVLPIRWDDYQGDMTLDTYKPYKGEKPFGVEMFFNPKLRTLSFQNYGNAMNNYIIFDECNNDKGIQLINKRHSR